jgi:hypothetical protein
LSNSCTYIQSNNNKTGRRGGPNFEPVEHIAPARQTQKPQGAPQPQAGSRDWRDCLLELLKTAPPEEVSRMFNREYLKEVLKEVAQNDPLLRLFFLLYG